MKSHTVAVETVAMLDMSSAFDVIDHDFMVKCFHELSSNATVVPVNIAVTTVTCQLSSIPVTFKRLLKTHLFGLCMKCRHLSVYLICILLPIYYLVQGVHV